jgi:antibiotic biosynthesis monooxygenase (ABM) superfamily enzyme
MAAVLVTYDVPSAEQHEAYGKWALKTVQEVALKLPGIVEIRAYRDTASNPTQAIVIYEFDSLDSATGYVNSDAYAQTLSGAEAHGCRNFSTRVLNTSPVLRGTVRPNS